MTSLGAQVRAKLDHPLIDGDSHIVEYMPVFLDFLKDAGGQGVVEQFTGANRGETWYTMSQEERLARRPMRGPWWPLPTRNTLDRCTSMLPKLYYERMDEFGTFKRTVTPVQRVCVPEKECSTHRMRDRIMVDDS